MSVIVPILSTFNDKGIKSAVREFQTAKTSIQKFGAVGKVFEGVGRSFTKNVTAPLLAVGGALALAARGAEKAEIANRKLGSVLDSMGYGQATARVSAYAEELERSIAVDADVIKATQTKLATFAELTASVNEAGGAFDRATMAALDLAAAGFGEAETNAVQLGKALQDPIKGITALARSGVTFTDQEKEKIKTLVESNRTLEAQDLILKAIEKQVGGTAAAGASAFDRIKLSMMQVSDEIGFAVLPLIEKLADYVANRLVPVVTAKIKQFTDAWKNLSPEVQKIILVVIALIASLGPMLIIIGKIIIGIAKFGAAIKALGITMSLTPIGILVLAIVGLGFVINEVVKKFGGWRESMRIVGNAVISLAEGALNFIINQLNNFVGGINLVIRGLNVLGFDFKEVGQIAQVEFKRISEAVDKTKPSFFDMKRDMNAIGKEGLKTGNLTSESFEKTGKAADKTKDKIKELRDALVKMRQDAVDKLQGSLKNAESQLDSARSKFNDFKNAISGNVTSILDFGKAAESENFLEGLVGQATDATDFANKVKQLIQLGLSERGISEVLNAGFDAGTRIADELIAGGSTVVKQVNTLLSSVQSVADQVGDFGARQFYQAGVTQGEALVNGILEALRQAQAELAAAVKAAAQGGDIRTFGARATNLLDAIGTIKGSKKSANAMAAFEQALAGSGKISKKEDAAIRSRFKLAKGGIVMGPTNALIGEAGPEAVIPLSGANSARGAMGSTINITVNAGIGTDGTLVGRQIVESIKRYERSSGPVFARA
jgi:hypothetical protein